MRSRRKRKWVLSLLEFSKEWLIVEAKICNTDMVLHIQRKYLRQLYYKGKQELGYLVSAKVDFRAKKIIRDNEEQQNMIKGSIYQRQTAILKVYSPNNRTTRKVMQKLMELKGEIKKPQISLNTSTPLSNNWQNKTKKKSTRILN